MRKLRDRIRWFYLAHIWCIGIRLHYVRLFASAIWHWDSCDFSPTLRMMAIAFKEMSKLHREHGMLVRADRTARETQIVAELCRRLEEDNYAELAGYAKYDQMTEFQRTQWAKHTMYLGDQDQKYLGKMISKHLQKWWN